MTLSDKQREILLKKQNSLRQRSRLMVIVLYFVAFALVTAIAVASVSIVRLWKKAVSEAPSLTILDTPYLGSPSSIYDAEGNLMMTLSADTIFREPVDESLIPDEVCDAFVYTVDPLFHEQKGTVFFHFASDFIRVVLGRNTDSELSITGQLCDGLLMTSSAHITAKDRIVDLFQLQYLQQRLSQELSERQILAVYLNNVYLGSNCFGVQAASLYYFGKPVSSLTLSEALVLAAIAVDPTNNNPFSGEENNRETALKALEYMQDHGVITRADASAVSRDTVYQRLCRTNAYQSLQKFDSCTREIFRQVAIDMQTRLGFSPMKSYRLLISGGLEITSTFDPRMQAIVEDVVQGGEIFVQDSAEEGYLLLYSLILSEEDGSTTVYNENDVAAYLEISNKNGPIFKNVDEMNEAVKAFRESTVQGRTIVQESFQPVAEPQCSVIVMDQQNGQVKAVSGGRNVSQTAINSSRVTDDHKSPGSLLSVLSSFAPAIDSCNATLATKFYDAPYSSGETPVLNWWGTQYLGYSNIRQGITYSMNVVAAKCLNSLVMPVVSFDYLKNFGLSDILDADRSFSLAAGTLKAGVTNEQMTAAYAAVASGGIYHRPVYYSRVLDRQGLLLLSSNVTGTRILKSTTAALLTDAMKDVISPGKGFFDSYGIEPTGKSCQVENVILAGKSGQNTDTSDFWFVGYSPEITLGVWYGYDSSMVRASKASGQQQIWQNIMARIYEGRESKSFRVTADLVPVSICSKSGLLTHQGFCDEATGGSTVYTELFAPGTEPDDFCDMHYALNICSLSGQIASDSCPSDLVQRQIFLRINDANLQYGYTTDYELFSPSDLGICELHTQ